MKVFYLEDVINKYLYMKRITQGIKNAVALAASATTLALPMVAHAQRDIESGLSGIRSLFPAVAFNSVPGLIVFVIQILLYIAGGVAVLFVIIGGFQYITSAGNAEGATKGKKTVVNAIIGIVLIILSYMIISVITNTILGYRAT